MMLWAWRKREVRHWRTSNVRGPLRDYEEVVSDSSFNCLDTQHCGMAAVCGISLSVAIDMGDHATHYGIRRRGARTDVGLAVAVLYDVRSAGSRRSMALRRTGDRYGDSARGVVVAVTSLRIPHCVPRTQTGERRVGYSMIFSEFKINSCDGPGTMPVVASKPALNVSSSASGDL